MRRIETTLGVIAVALAVSGSVGLCFLALAKHRVTLDRETAYHDRLNGPSGRTMIGFPGFAERLNDADKSSASSAARPEDLK